MWTGTPRRAKVRRNLRSSSRAQRAIVVAWTWSARQARAEWNGAPPGCGGPPSIRSNERFPTSASGGTVAESTRRDQYGECCEQEGCGEARQRSGEADRSRVRMGDDARPPARADRRQPLGEREAESPGNEQVDADFRCCEDA